MMQKRERASNMMHSISGTASALCKHLCCSCFKALLRAPRCSIAQALLLTTLMF